MKLSATFHNIDQDFGFEAEALKLGSWSADFKDEEAFIEALHRMAIASSQHSLVDFPEIETRGNSGRVIVRAIHGQLFYTDYNSQNRKDLKVTPVEAVRLLGGEPTAEAFKIEEVPEEAVPLPLEAKPYRRTSKSYAKPVVLILLLIVLSVCSRYVWRDISDQPRLYTAPQFVPSLSEESDVLRKYADVYVSEYREGAMLFELTQQGQFSRYEMWHAEELNSFVLVKIDSYPVKVGQHDGQTAMLANEVYLLELNSDEMIRLHGVDYRRHHGTLSSIGKVVIAKP